jgi:hypothetical protein
VWEDVWFSELVTSDTIPYIYGKMMLEIAIYSLGVVQIVSFTAYYFPSYHTQNVEAGGNSPGTYIWNALWISVMFSSTFVVLEVQQSIIHLEIGCFLSTASEHY